MTAKALSAGLLLSCFASAQVPVEQVLSQPQAGYVGVTVVLNEVPLVEVGKAVGKVLPQPFHILDLIGVGFFQGVGRPSVPAENA